MTEILTCDQNNGTGEKVTVVIDRASGQFSLFGFCFTLNLLDNIATLVKNDDETPVCIGLFHRNTWYFEGMNIFREDKDPFIAAIQVICNIL